MNKIKKVLTTLLSLIITLQMIVPTHAQEGTINITNAIIGQTYSIYQILNVESYDSTHTYFSYTVTDDWLTFINKKTIKDVYVTVNEGGYVNWIEGADVNEFAKLAINYAKDNNIEPTASLIAEQTSISFNNLALGYYLIDTTVGTICSLDTTSPSVTVLEKNKDVSIVKEVLEDSTSLYSKYNDAQIDETITYKVTIYPSAGALNYVLHDQMSEGLTFDYITAARLNGKSMNSVNYTVETSDCCENCAFEITFDKAFLDTIVDGDVIEFEYTAHLNNQAVVSGSGNDNKAYVSYGENNDLTSNEDSTKTYCWDASVFKMTVMEDEKIPLAQAVFEVLDENGDRMLFSLSDEGVYKVDSEGDYSSITTSQTGLFYIEGLDDGVYELKEIEAPAGYNLLTNTVELTITRGEIDTTGLATYTTPLVEVENNTGAQMPNTGGIGTTLFYCTGGSLVLISAIAMIIKKRFTFED